MKLFISALLFLPSLAFAAATNVDLNYSSHKDFDKERMCVYGADLYLGNENTIVPFQLLARQEDGTLATLMKPDVIHQAKNGQFYIQARTVKYVKLDQTCPAKAQLILVK